MEINEVKSTASAGEGEKLPLTYAKFIGRRASIAEAVANRKKAEAMQLEFENTRIELIDECIKSGTSDPLGPETKVLELRSKVLYLIFSPVNAKNLEPKFLNENYHIITDSINLDSGIWKLVADGKWDTLKKLHRPTLDEFCPDKFKDKLALFWELI
jgi:hypothetical protein